MKDGAEETSMSSMRRSENLPCLVSPLGFRVGFAIQLTRLPERHRNGI